ncbi:MAG: DUF192 domain-containing protein [Patescibacteria group bacterium]
MTVTRALTMLLLATAFAATVLLVSRVRPSASSSGIADVTSLRMEIADTDASRMRGLSGRTSLAPEAAMLFVFGERGIYPFWMKEMRFPIDIVWIDGDTVVDVTTLQPPEEGMNVPSNHIPFAMADRVLEVNAGLAESLGLTKGATVVLPR